MVSRSILTVESASDCIEEFAKLIQCSRDTGFKMTLFMDQRILEDTGFKIALSMDLKILGNTLFRMDLFLDQRVQGGSGYKIDISTALAKHYLG